MITEKQKKYLESIPKIKRGIFEKAYSGKSKSNSLKAKCIDCVGYEDLTSRIGQCTIERCPLWPYRPYQKKRANKTHGNDIMIKST